jgi:hypothetical protein
MNGPLFLTLGSSWAYHFTLAAYICPWQVFAIQLPQRQGGRRDIRLWVRRLWETNAAETATAEDDHFTAGQLPKVSELSATFLITFFETGKGMAILSYGNYWVFGVRPSSDILKSREHSV